MNTQAEQGTLPPQSAPLRIRAITELKQKASKACVLFLVCTSMGLAADQNTPGRAAVITGTEPTAVEQALPMGTAEPLVPTGQTEATPSTEHNTPIPTASKEPEETNDFEWLGETYKLGRQHAEGEALIEEYYPTGENASTWSQCISVQSMPGVSSGALAARLLHNRTLQIRLSREAPGLKVLRIHNENSRHDPQEAVMMIQEDVQTGRLKVITYVARAAKMEPSRLQMQLTAWMERFLGHPCKAQAMPPSAEITRPSQS